MQKDSTSLCTQADWTVALQKAKIQDPMEKVVWALLQSAGILDMEKLIEHRPPLDKLSFWKRPAIPQREHRTHARFLTAIDIYSRPCRVRRTLVAQTPAQALRESGLQGRHPRKHVHLQRSGHTKACL